MTKTRKLLEVEMLLLMKMCSIKKKMQTLQMQINSQSRLEEISKSDVLNKRQNTKVEPESESGSEPKQIVESITPEILVKRYSRTILASQKYSPPLHYLLLTDACEPKHFTKAMQGDESIK